MNQKKSDQRHTPLLDALVTFSKKEPAYFRIPAHRFERGIHEAFRQAAGEKLFRLDLSEAEGLDDLHQPEGAIKEAQMLAAQLWNAKETFFLVNGTTCGNEAMVLGTVNPGERVLIPRNAHKSILMGLILSGADPCYVYPQYEKEWNLWTGVRPEDVRIALRQNQCKAAFLVNPTYYGICSDIQTIGDICHAHDTLLCVDEAHGSHLYFSDDLPDGALAQGADLCAQSIHKTAGSMTQSSMLQIGSDRVSKGRIVRALQMVQSTSPSYVLMASLDAARAEMAAHGQEHMRHALLLAQMAREQISEIPGIQVLEKGMLRWAYDLDLTRLVFSARELGIGGYELQRMLYEQAGVSTELADEENVVCVITYANTVQDVERLVEALKRIADGRKQHKTPLTQTSYVMLQPPKRMNPREAFFAQKTAVDWNSAIGKIAGEMVVPYPPGIPLLYPGEEITPELWQQIEEYRRKGLSIHGPEDVKLNTINIIF